MVILINATCGEALTNQKTYGSPPTIDHLQLEKKLMDIPAPTFPIDTLW